jgi:MFS family permease
MIISLLAFMLGSGLCGGARYVKSMDMLIAARAVQGMGGGGILAMTEISKSERVLCFNFLRIRR